MTRAFISAVPPQVTLLRGKAQGLQQVLVFPPKADQHADKSRQSLVLDIILRMEKGSSVTCLPIASRLAVSATLQLMRPYAQAEERFRRERHPGWKAYRWVPGRRSARRQP